MKENQFNTMEETKFLLAGNEYIVKQFYFNPDRIEQIKFNRKYLLFEKDYIGEELCDKFYNSIHKMKLLQDLAEHYNKDVNNEAKQELRNQLSQELISEDVSNEFYRMQMEAIQIFFFTDENNAKKLCELLFKNYYEINHNQTQEKELLEYNNFILDVFNYFFFSKKKSNLI